MGHLGWTMVHAVSMTTHVWHDHRDSTLALSDWGRHNTETTYSWWPNWEFDWANVWINTTPFVWYPSGSDPLSTSYHKEHTLFPGINYELLPQVARIVKRTSRRF